MPDVTLRIEKIAAGGEGIARVEGKSVFVAMSAPCEKLLCRVTEDHGSWARAEPLEIIEPSPHRVAPACALYGVCGGCDLQHLDYNAQVKAKTAILKDSFERIGGFIPPEPKVFCSEPWEYRSRIQLHYMPQSHRVPEPRGEANAHGDGRAGFGFKARKSGEIVRVPDCLVAVPEIREVLRKEARGESVLAPPPEKERFTVYGRNGLLLYEGGPARGSTKLLDREILLDASVFFQSNSAMLEKLIMNLNEVAGCAASRIPNGEERRMADLYCGVGTFSVFLAEYFTHIDLMEENKNALVLARENLAPKGAALSGENHTAEFFAVKDTAWVKLRHPDYGFIVLDPPRQGLASAVTQWLAESGPPVLAYVSCAPATLARDSKILRRGGYELTELHFYDFYPQTAHIESLALFAR